MQITLEMGPDFANTLASLGRVADDVRRAVHAGMEIGADNIGLHISKNLLMGQYLKPRSRNLSKAVGGWMEGSLHAVIGVRPNSGVDDYAWLLGDNPENQPKTIRPKNAKYLAIPIGEALTTNGVAKWASPRDAEKDLGAKNFVMIPMKTGNQYLLGYRRGKTERARFRPLFVLVKSVQIYDTGAIVDGTYEKLDGMTQDIQSQLDKIQ